MSVAHTIKKAIQEKEAEREEINREIDDEISKLQGQLALMEEINQEVAPLKEEKDPSALIGGPARAAKMTPEERSEAARNAANERWREGKEGRAWVGEGGIPIGQKFDPQVATDLLALLEYGATPRVVLTEALGIPSSKMSMILSVLVKENKIELTGPNKRRNTVYKLSDRDDEVRLHVGHGEVK